MTKRNVAFSEMPSTECVLVLSPTARCTSLEHYFTVKYCTYLYRAIDISVLLGFVFHVLDLFQIYIDLA